MKMKKGNSKHNEWNLQGFSYFWSSIFVSLWPVADTEYILECIYCLCFRDSSAGLFCLQVSVTVFLLLLLFLLGSWSTGTL